MLEGAFFLTATPGYERLDVERHIPLILPVEGTFPPPVATVACDGNEDRVVDLGAMQLIELLIRDPNRRTARPLEPDPLTEEKATVVSEEVCVAVLTEHRAHTAYIRASSEG